VPQTFCLRHNKEVMTLLRFASRLQVGTRLTFALFLALAGAAIAPSVSGADSVAAQAGQDPCALLTLDEIQTLAPMQQIDSGVATAVPAVDSFSCRYAWGSGIGRFNLAVTVNPASRMFVGRNVVTIREGLLSSVVPETADTAIPEVGEAAAFRAHSPMYVSASAYLKDRILQLNLDGYDASEMKEQLISLLKSAASRL
jgi:hypothetical protein